MGNVQSNKKSRDLTQIIDYIATNFILTNNFKDFKNLTDQKYCNNLVILTSKIINHNLNYKQVEYLSQRIKKGEEVNEMTKDNIIFFEKDKLNNVDLDSNIRKKRLCLGIAKFYIKIAHIYAAIVTTVNPTYNYKNENGEVQEVDLENKIYIPKYSNTTINRNNLCSTRINSLLNKSNFGVNNNEEIKIKPDFCDKNINKQTGKTKMLINEPGIPELAKLYYDKYDYNAGYFIGMTEKTKKIYENDVKEFYMTFTGKKIVPDNVKTFSDVPLKEFHNMNKCKNNGPYRNVYTGTKKQKYFKKYAQHIENMMKTTNENQNKLIKIIDKIFILINNNKTNKKEIIINPNLTYKKLDLIIQETKAPIINLYLKCEKDYLEGLNIFEVIVNMMYKETSQNQLDNLNDNINNQKNILPKDTEKKVPTDNIHQDLIQNIKNEEEKYFQERVSERIKYMEEKEKEKEKVKEYDDNDDNDNNVSLEIVEKEKEKEKEKEYHHDDNDNNKTYGIKSSNDKLIEDIKNEEKKILDERVNDRIKIIENDNIKMLNTSYENVVPKNVDASNPSPLILTPEQNNPEKVDASSPSPLILTPEQNNPEKVDASSPSPLVIDEKTTPNTEQKIDMEIQRLDSTVSLNKNDLDKINREVDLSDSKKSYTGEELKLDDDDLPPKAILIGGVNYVN